MYICHETGWVKRSKCKWRSTLSRLHIAYHNILKLFIGSSKYESTSLLCTLFDVQCCQSVIRNMVYRFMCRLDSSVNYNLNDILTCSLRFTSRIHKHWNKLLYVNSWLNFFLIYTALGQNALHTVHIVCLMSSYGLHSHMYLLYVSCWVWNKVIELKMWMPCNINIYVFVAVSGDSILTDWSTGA